MSMAWFALALVCVRRLFLTASGGDETLSCMATFLFGISQTVAQPVSFISNRSDLMVIVGASLAATRPLMLWPTRRTGAAKRRSSNQATSETKSRT